ncbi:MAG TPA: hypothetical protein PK773_08715, partial [Aminivibrio sp.]|nr:hypothetical protein [Aminivibrio sp.]
MKSVRNKMLSSLKNLLAKHPYYPTIERKKKKGSGTERIAPSYNGTVFFNLRQTLTPERCDDAQWIKTGRLCFLKNGYPFFHWKGR